MEIELVELFKRTLDPLQTKLVEKSLLAAEQNDQYPTMVLRIIASNNIDLPVRQAASLAFKNYVRKNWNDDDEEIAGRKHISLESRTLIKAEIVNLMTLSPSIIQAQLSDCITIVANSDFPRKWDSLIDDIVSRFSSPSLPVILGLVQTAHSIFKRWRSETRSDALFTEIKFVLDRFAQPYLLLFKHVDTLITERSNDLIELSVLYDILFMLSKLFFDLNCQDIPEFFEDNLSEFMSLLHKYLIYSNDLLESDSDSEISRLSQVKASICEIVELYAQRYEDVFPMLPDFVSTTWGLLVATNKLPKNDIARSFICFLRSNFSSWHSSLFSSDEVLRQIVELVVIPNMSLRDSDVELFEDDPAEYIRRDLEGSDSDTRRRSATDLIRGLLDPLERPVTSIVTSQIGVFLSKYNNNPEEWKLKDLSYCLISSIAAKSFVTQLGVTSANLMVDVVEFFKVTVVPDLQQNITPILQVDAIKYVFTFRNQLLPEQLQISFPTLIEFLKSPHYVVYTYASICLERLLAMKSSHGTTLLDPSRSAHYVQPMMEMLLAVIERGKTPEKVAENEYVMKCLMRTVVSYQQRSEAQAPYVINHLNSILAQVSQNPSNPKFNHYLFECYAAIIRYNVTHEAVIQTINQNTLPLFFGILKSDVAEFSPYVFQLLAQILESQPSLTPPFDSLLSPILAPTFWSMRGNIPPLVRLLEDLISKSTEIIGVTQPIEPILGVFQKLISSKIQDVYGFDLLEAIFRSLNPRTYDEHSQQLVFLIFSRLQNSRTERFVSRFARFCVAICANTGLGPQFLNNIMNKVQPGILPTILSNFILPNVKEIGGYVEKKVCFAGLISILEFSFTAEGESLSKNLRAELLKAMLGLEEQPGQLDQSTAPEPAEDLDDVSFQNVFAGLNLAQRAKEDIFPKVILSRAYVVEQINRVDRDLNGQLMISLQNSLSLDERNYFRSLGIEL